MADASGVICGDPFFWTAHGPARQERRLGGDGCNRGVAAVLLGGVWNLARSASGAGGRA